MNQRKSSAELKALAKEILIGKYGTVIGALVLIQLITWLISFLTTRVVDLSSTIGYILYMVITFIVTLIISVFTLGQTSLYLNIASNQPFRATNIFNGFKNHPDKVIMIQFLLYIIILACMLPFAIFWGIYWATQMSILFIPLSICGTVGLVVAYIFSLKYSQVYYLLLDFPDYSAKEIMALSRKIMRGNTIRLFYITVSFIPMYLLGLLSLGIGYLYIIPYQNMTLTYFYFDIIHSYDNTNSQPEVASEPAYES